MADDTAETGRVAGIDHVSLPMEHEDEMVAFYRALGFDVAEHEHFVSVYAGAQMINLHRRSIWQREGFTLRAPAARPPCGDLCFVWEGSANALHARLEAVGAAIEETLSMLTAEDRRKVTATNCARLYGFGDG